MKRTLLLLTLAIFITTMAMAEGISLQTAQQQARDFIQKREAAGNRARRAPGTTAMQLTPTRQISGLYVFNIANDGGFVIVSNDDRMTPILGYSDSGSIDPDNMPANMRAWLQGYADEIAWLQQYGNNSIARVPKKIGLNAQEISPLMTTKWDQDEPYNNLCPYYEGTNRAVTGCVATAMAQVMNYHQWPREDVANGKDGKTQAIPGYTSSSYSIDLTAASLPLPSTGKTC